MGLVYCEALASNVPATSGLIGHPRERFPLPIFVDNTTSEELTAGIQDAAAQWDRQFNAALGVNAFRWTRNRADAAVIIEFRAIAGEEHAMGATDLDTNVRGVIRLPVTIDIAPPKSRGQSNATQVLFDVAAHELGHALGFPHINEPASIMCCDPGAIDFKSPAIRDEYIEARRHPDLSNMRTYLRERYLRFWRKLADQQSAHGSMDRRNSQQPGHGLPRLARYLIAFSPGIKK